MRSAMLKTLVATAALGAMAVTSVASANTLQKVKKAGYVKCGVNTGLPGFSAPDENGHWSGLDADFCRAVAAAALGSAKDVRFVPTTAKERFTVLQTGAVDVLSRNTTWTLTRDAGLGINFIGTDFYDGQGFLVKKSLGVTSAKQLSGATVCVLAGTTTELNLADYFRTNHLKYNPLTLNKADQTVTAFNAGRCDVLTSDSSQLAALRSKLPDPSSAVILPERISKEPLGPAVMQGDPQWANVVQWTLFTLIRAEELGIDSHNVDKMLKSDNPKVQRLLGVSGEMGKALGIPADFGYQIIKQVGNYGQIFKRNVGADSPLKLDRGLNALWTKGGLMYAMPLR